MSLGKISKQSGTAQLIIKSKKGQQINEREVYAINSGQISGLMHFDVIRKKKYFKLVYDVTGYTTLKGFLKNPLTKDSFAIILDGILSNIREMNTAYLNFNYVLIDINRVMVNPSTKKVYFVYIPIQSSETNTDLKSLLKEMISLAVFPSYEDNSYVREYIGILNEGINFSVFKLEEFVKRISAPLDMKMQKKVVCPKCNNVITDGINYCNRCGTKIFNNSKKDAVMFDPANGKSSTRFEGASVSSANGAVHKAYLLRKKTGEKIFIDKAGFMIGKDDRFCDYCIRGNTAVSRQHAEILSYNNHYFVVDKKSTNKTFLNEQNVPPESQIEIFNGATLRFADEEFVFFSE